MVIETPTGRIHVELVDEVVSLKFKPNDGRTAYGVRLTTVEALQLAEAIEKIVDEAHERVREQSNEHERETPRRRHR